MTYRPSEDGSGEGWAQRVHYQTAINSDLLWRVVGQMTERDNQDSKFDFLQAELFWDLSPDTSRWRTGLRFDAVWRNGPYTEQVNINWTNELTISPEWKGRFVVLTSTQFGERAADGVLVETRASIFRKINSVTVGFESYNLHRSADDFDAFGGRQQIGPFAVWPVRGSSWNVFTGALLGASETSPDLDLRLWLTKNF